MSGCVRGGMGCDGVGGGGGALRVVEKGERTAGQAEVEERGRGGGGSSEGGAPVQKATAAVPPPPSKTLCPQGEYVSIQRRETERGPARSWVNERGAKTESSGRRAENVDVRDGVDV